MRVLAIEIKHALDVAVQGSHDANPGKHRRPAQLRDQHQAFYRGSPFSGVRASFFGSSVA
jgi:hypothetical protein